MRVNTKPFPQPDVATDPLKFRDERRYTDKLKENRAKTGTDDTIHAGQGRIHGQSVTACVQDFKFMGGSLGMAAGEAIIASMEEAVRRETPYVMFAASGGARMQEGILSLMQLPRTTVAVQMLREAALPYIVVLTNPTTGGVSASYAMLGDIHIAEPGALIGFAGPRVIEQTIREKLPEGFQRSEYLMEHGMVDMVVPRTELRDTISNILTILMKQPGATTVSGDGGEQDSPAGKQASKKASSSSQDPAPQGSDQPAAKVSAGPTGASGSDIEPKPAPA